MKKRILSVLMTLLVAVCFIPTLAFADETGMKTVTVDVGGVNVENDDYKITDTEIKLLNENTIYELTGTTDKTIYMWGAAKNTDPIKNLYLKLDNATLNGNFSIYNSNGAKLVVEVPKGTTNTVKSLYAVNLTVTGSGTLNANNLGSTQCADERNLSALHITDTQINVTRDGNSCAWDGTSVLDGNAKVTITSSGNYSALKLGQTDKFKHSLTMKDNSKLYCLQQDATNPSAYYVSGIEAFNGASITLQDNAYLEAQGRDGKDVTYGDETYYTAGRGIESSSDIIVKDNATLKATAYGPAISTGGNVKATGGKITANSSNSNGIYAEGLISASNAVVEATGYYPAIYGVGDVLIKDSQVTASSENSCGIYSKANINITDSIVKANGKSGSDGIYADVATTVSGSWIETSGNEKFTASGESITNSVLFNGNTGKTIGNHKIPGNVEVTKDMTLAIDKDTSITVPDKTTFTNHGIINVKGSFAKEEGGTVICDSHNGGTATCIKKALCDICKAEYGELDPFNHESLKHIDAKAATKDQEGNIEYWYCDACGKYFADQSGKEQIEQADTVIAKLPADPAKPAAGKDNDQKKDSSASTGDDASLGLWAALLMLSGCAAAGAVIYRRKQNSAK